MLNCGYYRRVYDSHAARAKLLLEPIPLRRALRHGAARTTILRASSAKGSGDRANVLIYMPPDSVVPAVARKLGLHSRRYLSPHAVTSTEASTGACGYERKRKQGVAHA